jgi:hypothetical protein
MLDTLIEFGADLNAKSSWWAGPFGLLHVLPKDLALYAVQRGAKLDIHSAARLGLKEEVHRLLDENPALVHERGGDGQTPLHFAATLEIAKLLVDRGADINALDVDHESSPAQYMIRDRTAIARWLADRGARADFFLAAALGRIGLLEAMSAENPRLLFATVNGKWLPKENPKSGGSIYIWTLGMNKSPHQVAKEFGQDAAFQWLWDRSSEALKFAVACDLGETKLATALLERHPDISANLDPDLTSRLPGAAENNDTGKVALYLRAGWPADARARHDATALHWSGFHGNKEMAELLLPASRCLDDEQNDFKSTPLGWALHGWDHGWHRLTGNYSGAVKTFLKAGAKIRPQDAGNPHLQSVLREVA